MANTSNRICVICDHEFKQNEIALSLKIIGSPQDVNGNCRQICMQCANNLRDLALYNLASDFPELLIYPVVQDARRRMPEKMRESYYQSHPEFARLFRLPL